jgi:hypothetical protein
MDSSDNKFNDGSPAISTKKDPAHRFELGTLATNRILFALALLGVMLPLNSVTAHFHQIGFTYFAPRNSHLKGPYHLNAVNFFYLMETLLAAAVYFYGFGFIFKSSIPDKIGTFLYACTLLMPLLYVYTDIFAAIQAAINNLNVILYWIVGSIAGLLVSILSFAFIRVVNMRIGG